MKLGDAIRGRKSVKRYSSKAPDWRKIIKAIDSARFAPAAGNYINWRFILVSDERKIRKLAAASQQTFVGSAKYVVVVVSDDSKLERSYGERGKRFSGQQVGAAIENFLLSLEEEKLATCWVGHFDESQVKNVLEVSDKLIVEAMFPIGIETKIKTPEKFKTVLDNLLYFDKWGNKKMSPMTRVRQDSV